VTPMRTLALALLLTACATSSEPTTDPNGPSCTYAPAFGGHACYYRQNSDCCAHCTDPDPAECPTDGGADSGD
jgi:hypothetical protein